MFKVTAIAACLIIAGGMFISSGCVSRAKYNQTVAQLDLTRKELTESRLKCERAERDNERLQNGLESLAEQCDDASERVRATERTVSSLKANGQRAEQQLAEMRSTLATQTASIASLEKTTSQLADKLARLHMDATALAKESATPRETVTVATTSQKE